MKVNEDTAWVWVFLIGAILCIFMWIFFPETRQGGDTDFEDVHRIEWGR